MFRNVIQVKFAILKPLYQTLTFRLAIIVLSGIVLKLELHFSFPSGTLCIHAKKANKFDSAPFKMPTSEVA